MQRFAYFCIYIVNVKLNTMKKTLLFLTTILVTLSFTACSTSDDIDETPEVKSTNTIMLVGKWQLTKVETSFLTPKLYDYSQCNIIYEFKSDNVLTISGEIDNVTYLGHDIGDHVYSIIDDDGGYGIIGLPYGLKIDYRTSWYILTSKELKIDDRPLDGLVYTLIKTN